MRKVWIILVAFTLLAASQGPLTPSTTADFSGTGNCAWANPINAQTENGISAVCSFAACTPFSHGLAASNFGFTIPVGATINGILLEWKASTTLTFLGTSNDVQFAFKDGIGNTAFSPAAFENSALTGTLTFYSSGGAADLWGTTWSVSEINSSNFGAYLRVANVADPDPGDAASVDVMRLTVFYTAAATGHHQMRVIGYGNGHTETQELINGEYQ